MHCSQNGADRANTAEPDCAHSGSIVGHIEHYMRHSHHLFPNRDPAAVERLLDEATEA